jgi:hypothetical protein
VRVACGPPLAAPPECASMTAAHRAADDAREALADGVRRALTRPASIPRAEQHLLIMTHRRAHQTYADALPVPGRAGIP